MSHSDDVIVEILKWRKNWIIELEFIIDSNDRNESESDNPEQKTKKYWNCIKYWYIRVDKK